jgi:hypothetical protein
MADEKKVTEIIKAGDKVLRVRSSDPKMAERMRKMLAEACGSADVVVPVPEPEKPQ